MTISISRSAPKGNLGLGKSASRRAEAGAPTASLGRRRRFSDAKSSGWKAGRPCAPLPAQAGKKRPRSHPRGVIPQGGPVEDMPGAAFASGWCGRSPRDRQPRPDILEPRGEGRTPGIGGLAERLFQAGSCLSELSSLLQDERQSAAIEPASFVQSDGGPRSAISNGPLLRRMKPASRSQFFASPDRSTRSSSHS